MSEGIWNSPAFVGMFGDPFVKGTGYEMGGNIRALIATLTTFAQLLDPKYKTPVLVESQESSEYDKEPIAFPLTDNQQQFISSILLPQLHQCQNWAKKGMNVENPEQFQEFLKEWETLLLHLEIGKPVLVPGGYIGALSSHSILYVIEKVEADKYSFTICNKGPGADLYHNSFLKASNKLIPDENICDKLLVQSSVQISDVPGSRFLDMAFWSILFSLWVRKPPSEYHRVETIYDVLLPWLAGDRLLPVAFQDAELTSGQTVDPIWKTGHTPQRSGLGFCKSVVEAIRYLCISKGNFDHLEVKYLLLFKIRYRLFRQTLVDLEVAQNPALEFGSASLLEAYKVLSSIQLIDCNQGSHELSSIIPERRGGDDAETIVGIYFAKHSCGFCRSFSKKLCKLTKYLESKNKRLIIIVVSADSHVTEYELLTVGITARSWYIVPFVEMNARKRLIELFKVKRLPKLVLRSQDGLNILTPRGIDLVESDNSKDTFPWTSVDVPIYPITFSERICIDMAIKQVASKSLSLNTSRSSLPVYIGVEGLSHINTLVSKAGLLMQELLPQNLDLYNRTHHESDLNKIFTMEYGPSTNTHQELLTVDGDTSCYAGASDHLVTQSLGDFLAVPIRVNSIPLALAAFVRCRSLCESLLRRAAKGSTSSRMSLHYEIIHLLNDLFVLVLPVPDSNKVTTCMWRKPVAASMQLQCLGHIHSLLSILGNVWQSIEQPTRRFDSERSLASLCALSHFDALIRTLASDSPLVISELMNEGNGYVLAHRFSKANLSLQKTTSAMEFSSPAYATVRGQVLAYFASQDQICKHELFQYHMPEDRLEINKYSITMMFLRELLDRYHYQLIDPNNETPPTEMEALMDWFCSPDTPLAREHSEFAMTRDVVMSVKYLVTMESKDVELMRRRINKHQWQPWHLSFDDDVSSTQINRGSFFSERGLEKLMNSTLNWQVSNFRGSDQDIADVEVEGFMSRKLYFGEGQILVSPTDLSSVLASTAHPYGNASSITQIVTEDDIMHINDLPLYERTLSSEESEQLMSYLTVPYTSIPLVVRFFSSRDRVTYLFNRQLQNLFRAVLFECGNWVSSTFTSHISHIPLRKSKLLLQEETIVSELDSRVKFQSDKDYLGTANGHLVNEIRNAPDAILQPLLDIFKVANDLSEVSVFSANASFILFIVKIGVDILRYVTYVLDISSDDSKHYSALTDYRIKLMSFIFEGALKTLENWRAEAEKHHELETACIIHSYLVQLYSNLRCNEYTPDRITKYYGSITYVRNWHCFGLRVSVAQRDSGSQNDGALTAKERLLRWLQAYGINTENISQSSMDNYLQGRPLYLKIGAQTIQAPSIIALQNGSNENGTSVRIPPGEVLEAELFDTVHRHRREVIKWIREQGSVTRNRVLGDIVCVALRLNEPNTSWSWLEATEASSAGRYYCEYSKMQLDLQTGELLWRNDDLIPVPDSMTQFTDFKTIFGNRAMHCGIIAREEHRLWVKVIGTDYQIIEWDDSFTLFDQGVGSPSRFQVQHENNLESEIKGSEQELKMYWECPACTTANYNGDNINAVCTVCANPRFDRPPTRVIQPQAEILKEANDEGFIYLGKAYSRIFDPYAEVADHPFDNELWFVEILSKIIQALYPMDPEDKRLPFKLFLPTETIPYDSDCVRLLGLDCGNTKKKNRFQSKEMLDTFKEVIVYKQYSLVNFYALISHGRRMYRTLIFTSDSKLSLKSFSIKDKLREEPTDPSLLRAAGDPRQRQQVGGSLVILRQNVNLHGSEQYIPSRLLQGLLPSCLLEAFTFWKGEDGILRGEPVHDSQWFNYLVEVQFLNLCGNPETKQRVLVSRKIPNSSFTSIRRSSSSDMKGLKVDQQPVVHQRQNIHSSSAEPKQTVIEVSDDDIVQLMAMGFSHTACNFALRTCENNVALAATWLLDETNQSKIVEAEEVNQIPDHLSMSSRELHDHNVAILMSLSKCSTRVVAEYALEVFDENLDLAIPWIEDEINQDEIHRVEVAAKSVPNLVNQETYKIDEEKIEGKVNDEGPSKIESSEDDSTQLMYLMNLLEVNQKPDNLHGASLLIQLLTKLEDLSHILIWCTNRTNGKSNNCETIDSFKISLIELPRLKLRLEPKQAFGDVDSIRVESAEHNGWFVSDLSLNISRKHAIKSCKYLQDLCKLLPECLIMESMTKDYKVILPSHDTYRPLVQNDPLSNFLLMDRSSTGWQQAMETRYYTYPVHSSHLFLSPPSMSSSLYLILVVLLRKNYIFAMELIKGCHIDVSLSEEEKWIVNQFQRTINDRHPNACACRIRLSLGISLFENNEVPWKLTTELHDYLASKYHVDALCKLSIEEEQDALAKCYQKSPLLLLRDGFFAHINRSLHKNDMHNAENCEIHLPKPRVGGQPWLKLKMYGVNYLTSHAKKLSTIRYNRPGSSKTNSYPFIVNEMEATKIVWDGAIVGDEISGSNRGLGYLFLYECMNDYIVVNLTNNTKSLSRSFGELFTRFLHLKLSRWGRETIQVGEEEDIPSFALAQLAMMTEKLCESDGQPWGSLPADNESINLLARGANLYSKMTHGTLLKAFVEDGENIFLSKLESTLYQHTVISPLKVQFSKYHQEAECNSIQIINTNEVVVKKGELRQFEASNTACSSREISFKYGSSRLTINPENPMQHLVEKDILKFCEPDATVSSTLPFDLTKHPCAQSTAAKDLLQRLEKDIRINADFTNNTKSGFITGITPSDLKDTQTISDDSHWMKCRKMLHELIHNCEVARCSDRLAIEEMIESIRNAANCINRSKLDQKNEVERFILKRSIGRTPWITFNYLTSLLASTKFVNDVHKRNPYLEFQQQNMLEDIIQVQLLCNRIVLINQTISMAKYLLTHLEQVQHMSASSKKQLLQLSHELGSLLNSKRHYLHTLDEEDNLCTWKFDPRYLVFEYVFDILLRDRQVQMIDSFVENVVKGKSRVQQMIMGAGKTTVVGPLLTYILADCEHLVTHVMPAALLEQSRQILRSRFSNQILQKRVFTFEFDRSASDDPEHVVKLFEKLNRARLRGDVVCASPESIKSMMLKFVELLHSLEESSDIIEVAPSSIKSQNVRRLRYILEDRSDMADEIHEIIRLWQDGILIMDEVDVLLHPLHSELNFPIGNKFAIDLAANRWELPIWLLDCILSDPDTMSVTTTDKECIVLLHNVLEQGYNKHSLQRFPHLVLLDTEFYKIEMFPLLADITMSWLVKHFDLDKIDVDRTTIKYYLSCDRLELYNNDKLRKSIELGLPKMCVKLLNLARDWLHMILPHVISKINRVSYGLLTGNYLLNARHGKGGSNAESRLYLAVPFVGKDVPSRSSEFAHPDVLIGLTILAYRYEGMRLSDLTRVVSQLRQDFSRQQGPRDQRPASVLFAQWIKTGFATQNRDVGNTKHCGVLPLPLFQIQDRIQLARLHTLIFNVSGAIYYYLRQHVFPSCMNFQNVKISACGHELGSSVLFSRRIGFSGTPSNLLPMDLGECHYEPRSDGSIFHSLTTSSIVTIERKLEWTAKSLLMDIAQSEKHGGSPFHALIDTGALITGMENEEVAVFLLNYLPQYMEGVVYLDQQDRQMILLRDHRAPMPLNQCGIDPSKRFTFFDQIHTTGMDIKQFVNARAVLTLGKDMTFRDYAQGAYRMRGIETGQSIHLYMIPEVENRIRHEISITQCKALEKFAGSLTSFIYLVPAWLIINSMRVEAMQFIQLSLQELHNVWRRRALNALLDDVKKSLGSITSKHKTKLNSGSNVKRFLEPKSSTIAGEDNSVWLRQCINLFRMKISFEVEDCVPSRKGLQHVIEELVDKNKNFMRKEDEFKRVEEIKWRLSNTEQINESTHDTDMSLTAEVVHENEAEAEEEAEEEAEQEEQKMNAYTRDDEHPIPWSTEFLNTPWTNDAKVTSGLEGGNETVFYPLAEFRSHLSCPKVAFPTSLLISGNFFRRRWVGLGERRLKNLGLILEWSPQLRQEILKTIFHYYFTQTIKENSSWSPNDAAAHALQLSSAAVDSSCKHMPEVLKKQIDKVKESNPVYLIAVSLSEGETLRRMMHMNHPVLQVCEIALRTCEGKLLESSSITYSSIGNATAIDIFDGNRDTINESLQRKLSIGIQCLKFFNNEMYYSTEDLNLLLEGLADIPVTIRNDFFQSCLRLRRRERQLWGDTPLAKIFTDKSEWHLLNARARLQQFEHGLRAIAKRKKHAYAGYVATTFRRYDENNDEHLTISEAHKCLSNFQLGFSSTEIGEIINLLTNGKYDTIKGESKQHFQENIISLKALCSAFSITETEMRTAWEKEDAAIDVVEMDKGEITWVCPVCTLVNVGGSKSCSACNEPSPNYSGNKKAQSTLESWQCRNCTYINHVDDTSCAICELSSSGLRAVPKDKWICAGEQGGCTFFNPKSSFYCEVCNRARPDLASVRF